jgi:hypothetical protein
MSKQIGYFGGTTYGRILLENGHKEELWFERELWFDRDIDGRWLVGVTDPHTPGDEDTGAIVVKDETVAAFIELLGKLVIQPETFADEPVLIGPSWNGQWPER